MFKILGPLRVSSTNGVDLPITGHRQRTILGLLLLHPERVVSDDVLIDSVWPINPPRTARQQVQNCVGMLRRTLGTDLHVERRYSGYIYTPTDSNSIDSLVFSQLVNQARTAPPQSATQLLGNALALWRGPALVDLDTPALDWARTSLREQHLTALVSFALLAVTETAQPALNRAITELSRWQREYPYSDGLVHALASALGKAGRRTEAILALGRYREQIVADLGIAPDETLLGLETDLRNGRPDDSRSQATDGANALSQATRHLANALASLDNLNKAMSEQLSNPVEHRCLECA